MHKIIALLLLALPAWAACPDAPTDYTDCLPVPVDNTKVSGSSDLTNFVAWLDVTDLDLRTVANGGKVQDGEDIRIQVGSTALDYEKVSYSATTGQIQAWLRIPTLLYASDTQVYIYVGKTGASGESNASGVHSGKTGTYHLDESASTASGHYIDQTANANGTLTDANANSTSITGKLANAVDFYGDSDYITIGDPAGREPGAGPISITAWVRPDTWDEYNTVVAKGGWGSGHLEMNHQSTGSNGYMLQSSDNYTGSNDSRAHYDDNTTGSWVHVAAVWTGNGGYPKIYTNGVLRNTGTIAWSTITGDAETWQIGARANGLVWDGGIDEVNFWAAELSADWIATEYANQNSPSTFFVKGSWDTPGGGSAAPVFRVQGVIGE